MSNIYPTIGFSDIADTLGKIFDGIVVKPNENPFIAAELKSTAPYKYTEENGNITLDVVITGHATTNIKVTWCEQTHTLKIVDVVDEKENETRSGNERPWYYTPLKLEFTLPETTNKKTFEKSFVNGVLTLKANYNEKTDKVTDVEI